MSPFQRALLEDMKEGVWYSVYRNSGLENPELPEWFYRQQSQPWATIMSMLSPPRTIAIRFVTKFRLPIVAKCYGLDKPRRIERVGAI
jgi:hypothetical protein